MAETPFKHQREEAHGVDVEENKRQKSYNHILSILEDEEEEPTQDLSSLIITLQQELSSDSTFETLLYPCLETDPEILSNVTTTTNTIEGCPSWSSSSSSSSFSNEEAADERERFMRHLLEASDDELGIPGREETPEFLNNV
ncbi:hypothetical protein K2173_022001 [Erythroxylum novogranatense]|uniref:Uncharacterized protein n=1 Tax=Erythroxylum novogranatense TaxID=1862640 RepID=A0AAV8T332_9ROSI|nr:hypothetical protein K2173_022001 [Erythroxylum novogranatense]